MEPLHNLPLDELKQKIYKEQFHDYEDPVSPMMVLDELQNLKKNPRLLDYVLKCLANQQITTVPNRFYCAVVQVEERPAYNEKIHGTFEKYVKFCIAEKKGDILLRQVYPSLYDMEKIMMNKPVVDLIDLADTRFQKYTIKEIGQ
jgi:hypothetical protein